MCYFFNLAKSLFNLLLLYIRGAANNQGSAQINRIFVCVFRNNLANSQTKCNKVTHRSGTDKIAVPDPAGDPLHEGKTFDSARTVLHRKTKS